MNRGRITWPIAAVLLALLVLPGAACMRLGQTFDPRLIGAYAVLISLVAFLLYRHDKRRAEIGGRRTPEATLHWVELLGGWPGAFLAQRVLRHKVSKLSYQVNFWAIVVFHEIAAFDCTQGWLYTRKALAFLADLV